MQRRENIADCYNKTASAYAEKFMDELDHKIFDRDFLKSFAERNGSKGKTLDLGCGPGHITDFLQRNGCKDILGIDLSVGMIETARRLQPSIPFEQGNMLDLPFSNASIGNAVAMYSIIHFDYETLGLAFREIHRILVPGAEFLFSFHIGDEVLHRDEFLGEKIDIDFYLLKVETVVEILKDSRFTPLEIIERYPHPEIEYASKRCYILSQAT